MNERLRTAAYIGAETVIFASAAYFLSRFAFSRGVKRQIHERDGYQCVVCGSEEHLEAAHIDHTRGPNYNKPENGVTLCTLDHLIQHIEEEGMNGLTPRQNQWAIEQISKRV